MTKLPTLGVLAVASSLAFGASSASAFETGNEMVAACRVFAADGRGAGDGLADPCRKYLHDFFVATDEARVGAYLGGVPHVEGGPCIRLPDNLSFAKLAELIVAQADTVGQHLEEPPLALIEATLAANFPCPEPPPE